MGLKIWNLGGTLGAQFGQKKIKKLRENTNDREVFASPTSFFQFFGSPEPFLSRKGLGVRSPPSAIPVSILALLRISFLTFLSRFWRSCVSVAKA